MFDYIDGGADGEVTLGDNRRSWDQVLFRPRNAVRLPDVDTTTELFGTRLSMPVLLAPVGYSRLFHPRRRDWGGARARAAGIGYVLSTFAGYRVDEVAAAAGPLWYQLYLAGGRAVVETSLARAWNAGCRVLAVTIDTNAPGHRERDIRNHSSQLIGKGVLNKVRFVPHLLRHPRWLSGFLADRKQVMFYPNVVIPGSGPLRAQDVRGNLARSMFDWEDMTWIRRSWPGPILMKGVITANDARQSMDEGAAGVIVSNHGGRQLDTCCPTARALPEVWRAVRAQGVVLVDGGIRRERHREGPGHGREGCPRRPRLRLRLAGPASRRRESDRHPPRRFGQALGLLGCPSVKDLSEQYVELPKDW